MLMSIFTPFYTLGLLIDNIFWFLYRNFPSFIINACLLVVLSAVFISVINNALFNPPEQPLTRAEIIYEQKKQKQEQEIENKIILLKKDKLQFVKRLPEPSDQVNFNDSVKYQGDYQFNLNNPILTKPKPGQTLIYRLGQSGSMLSTVVPKTSTFVFENI